MLKNIYIENIALISKLNLAFEQGLLVLSGETGAGKSIIIDALAFVLGGKADKSLIKSGTDRAFVEAVFVPENNGRAHEVLIELGFEPSECVVSRTITVSGKNEIRINGRVSTLVVLKQLSSVLVDIFGQHDQTYLLKNENHLTILDDFSSNQAYAENVTKLYDELKQNEKEFSKFGGSDAERERTISMLKYQIDEIDGCELSVKEEEELQMFKVKAASAEKVSNSLSGAATLLGENEFNALSAVTSAVNSMTQISAIDKEYESLRGRLESCKYELQDIYQSASSHLSSLDFDQREIDKMEMRLDKIKSLKRKYGGTVEEVLKFLSTAKNQLSELENADETIQYLKKRKGEILCKLYDACKLLSTFRKTAAENFSTEVMNELQDLGLKGSTFTVSFVKMPSIEEFEKYVTKKGCDKVEFLFSANKGEPVKPLAKIVSGGETSRFMLAVKNITARIEAIPTMIFDEIDSGISGAMASVVAQKLARISRSYQSIVITHLPQIACMGDSNFLVDKVVDNNKTFTRVIELNTAGKEKEVQRLIGGADVGEFGGLHAKDMIKWADAFKKAL